MSYGEGMLTSPTGENSATCKRDLVPDETETHTCEILMNLE